MSLDSILSQARPVAEAKEKHPSVLCYGRNRIGKTTWACQFPKPLLLISCEPSKEGGAQSVSGMKDVNWMLVRDADTLQRIGTALQTEKHPYQSVVIDSATSLEKILLMEIMKWNTPAELLKVGNASPVQTKDYIERTERFRKLIRIFLDLDGISRVILANEKDHNPPEDRKNSFAKGMQEGSFFAADAGAGTARWLMDNCNYIVQMFQDAEKIEREIEVIKGQPKQKITEETGRRIRRLRLGYHPNFAAGARVDQFSGVAKELPEFIDGKNPTELYLNFRKAIQ